MIAITLEDGSLLRLLTDSEGGTFGFHRFFGFLKKDLLESRLLRRKRHGLPAGEEKWSFQFQVSPRGDSWEVAGLEGCRVEAQGPGKWSLHTAIGNFFVTEMPTKIDTALLSTGQKGTSYRLPLVLALLVLLFGTWTYFYRPPTVAVEPEPLPEVVTIQVPQPKSKPVVVPMSAFQVPDELAKLTKKNKDSGAAVKQNLGFLGLLGKKDLSKALGGMPTSIEEASPGAGPGGKDGSGGEMLVGLGKGVRRTTVGNTGVAGLGGLGTGKGPGGGAGGYGNSWVGSGGGKAISAIPLSQDVILEGGLDKAVIQATIAKYLSQVRACYEEGLGRNSGLLGQVTMNFEINGGGMLNFSKVAKSTLGDETVEKCISDKMMGWQFPKPLGGVAVKVSYPFLLRPVNS